MKKFLIFLSLYSLLIILLAIISLYQSLGSRIVVSSQMFLINLLVLSPVIIFSICVLFYLRRR